MTNETTTKKTCKACSGELIETTRGRFHTIETCAVCGGIHVYATNLTVALGVVDFSRWAPTDARIDDQRFFSVVWFNESRTRESLHGWYDTVSRRMTQVG